MEWPASRFEAAYEAMLKRELVDDMRDQKGRMIAALWSNSNYDPQEEGQESPRNSLVEEIEGNFDEAVARVYGYDDESLAEDIDWEDPFFAAAKRGMEKIDEQMPSVDPDGTMGEQMEDDPDGGSTPLLFDQM